MTQDGFAEDWRYSLHEAVINGDAATVEAIIVAAGPDLIDDEDSVGYPINPIE